MGQDIRIPLLVPFLRGREADYLQQCLQTNWVSSEGPLVEQFEREISKRMGGAHTVATMNGTAALHLAVRASGVGPGDKVLLPSLTFVATTNAVTYTGATPVFVDCDPERWTLTEEIVREYLRQPQAERGIRALLPVHLYGLAAPMRSLCALAQEQGWIVIEDAAESLGTPSGGRPTGTWGRAAALSFNGNKIITSGGGGMLVSGDAAVAERAGFLSRQAHDRAEGDYMHREIGYNYRMTNLQAAVGLGQLEILDVIFEHKRRISRRYEEGLRGLPGIRKHPPFGEPECNYWMICVVVDPGACGFTRHDLQAELQRHGIQSRPLFHPNHDLPPYRGYPRGPMPVTEELYARALCLPSSAGLRDEEIDEVCGLVRALAGGVR